MTAGWMLVVMLCTTSTPVECRPPERWEAFRGGVECRQRASDVRHELEPVPFGYNRVRDCIRIHAGPPVLPTRKPDRN